MSKSNIVEISNWSGRAADDAASREAMGEVIDRRDFRHWLRPDEYLRPSTRRRPSPDLDMAMELLSERVERVKKAFQEENDADVILQSAQVSLQSTTLGLPRTAQLSAQIGESQMNGHIVKTAQLINKLDCIVYALCEDIARKAH